MALPSPQFHKILGGFFLLPCCAQVVRATGLIMNGRRYPSTRTSDSRLEGVLKLEKKITASGGKIFATSGKKADLYCLKECKEAGGSIATPRNPERMMPFVLRESFNTYAYLGIKESLIQANSVLDGTQLGYTNWLNEPSGKGKEECVEMYTDGTWNDKKCNQNRLIVCQF
ncbi:LOW QUALITY PROTEIN: pulmonary surfactant-associated protein A-like [Pterocles gutturalis]